ncbi:MAG: pyrroline-5-carboxylate reductase [Tissierellia bacterium]|jgi:pyrroline-5-carboxylate reductase|nr:pyrroline-5-carboxylate reductase [Tissierellia bacterium]
MTIGFIGLGNMGLAMLRGIKEKRQDKLVYAVKTQQSARRLEMELGFGPSPLEEVYESDVIFLAVKPVNYPYFLKELSGVLRKEQIIVTMAPGFSLEQVQSFFMEEVKVLRSMPATPAQIGMSVSGLCFSDSLTKTEKDRLRDIFNSFGWSHDMDESLMEAFGSFCGVMPAFLMNLIEAMADQAVAWGIPRKQAYLLAGQIMQGSGALLLETGLHPAQLKDQVTSPGGTTIEGLLALEEWGGARAMQKAMQASYAKSIAMGENF